MTHTTLAQTLTALETQGTPEALEILAIYHDSGEPTPEPTQGSGGEHSTQAQGFVLADTLEGILRGMSAMPSTLGHDTHHGLQHTVAGTLEGHTGTRRQWRTYRDALCSCEAHSVTGGTHSGGRQGGNALPVEREATAHRLV